MNWNKLKKQLETFLSPAIEGRVTYSSTGYRYTPDKKKQCYILVDKSEILSIRSGDSGLKWYQNEQEIKEDSMVQLHVSADDIERVRQTSSGKIPEERLEIIARNQIMNTYAKDVMKAQANLFKSDFSQTAATYLKKPIDECLKSDDILLNIFALLDRRVGKNRLVKLEDAYRLKHPAVQYFYRMRRYG